MQDKYPNRTPRTRIILIIFAVVLLLLALSSFKVLIGILGGFWLEIMSGYPGRFSLFGTHLKYESASEPRSSNDPKVRASFVFGVLILFLGFSGFSFGASNSLLAFIPEWLFTPGFLESLMGVVMICTGLDLLHGGLARAKTPDKSAATKKPAISVKPQDKIEETKKPAIAASVVLGRYATPWLILAGLAHFGQWHGVIQLVVTFSGFALLLFAARSWPFFAIPSAFACAFYGWSAIGHSSSGSIPMLVFLLIILSYLAIAVMVFAILGMAASGLSDSFILRKQETAPLFLQVGLAVLACVLAMSGYKHHVELKAKRKADIEAAHAKEIAAYSAKNKKSEQENNLEAPIQPDKPQALTPLIWCQFERTDGWVLFTKQDRHLSPGLAGSPIFAGQREDRGFTINVYGEKSIREVALLDVKNTHQQISQYADTAPILHLPSNAVVFMAPGKSDLFLRDADKRIFHLTTFEESLLQHKPVVCSSKYGKYWVVALGPVVSLFDQQSPDAPIREVFQKHGLPDDWFK